MENQKYIESLVIATTLTVFILVVMLFVLYVLFLKKKTNLIHMQQLKDLEFEQELNDSLVEMKEQTLHYVGQELHDNIGQKMSVVRLRSNQLSSKLDGQNKMELEEISELLRESIQDLRDLSKTLNINNLDDFNLLSTLELELKRINRLKYIHIDYSFQLEEKEIKIPSKHKVIIYRILQELLNNILKHSKARKVSIDIKKVKKELQINLVDNGIGFDTALKSNGSGLQNIKQRAKMLHAKFNIESKANFGTITLLKYPLR